jgi:thiol:disulfide interchange protein DsbG
MHRRHVLLNLSAAAFALLGACSKNDAASASAAPASAAAPPPAAPARKDLSAADSQRAYEKAAAGSGFTVGSVVAANQVLVFFDPQCPHCAALWSASQPLLHKLKMVWLPVGFLRAVSTPQGALLLSAKDPAAAMSAHEALLIERKGGLQVPDQVDAALLAKVKANTDLLQTLGADSVPFILYRNAKTGAYGSHSGALSTEQLAEMAGI